MNKIIKLAKSKLTHFALGAAAVVVVVLNTGFFIKWGLIIAVVAIVGIIAYTYGESYFKARK